MTRRLSTVLAALVVVSAVVAGVQPAAAFGGSSSGVFAPSVSTDRGLFGWSPSESVVEYAGGNPGWVVEFEDGHAGDLEAWVSASADRQIRARDNDSNMMVVSAPSSDVGLSWSLGLSSTLREQSYIKRIGVNRMVSVNPIRESDLARKSNWSSPDGGWLATWGGFKGKFNADGAAWSREVNESSLEDARAAVGADRVSSVDGSGVRVAVLDTGLDYNKSLYGDRVVAGFNAITGEKLNTSLSAENRSYDKVFDGASSKHGSWVTTAIAGNGPAPNGTGIAPGASIIPVKVLADDGSGKTSTIASGLEFACGEANADVVSMSLGSPVPSMQLEAEISECLTEDGVSAVAVAAGNNRMTYRYTASPGDSSETVITVAATDSKAVNESESAYFSAVGPDPTNGAGPDVAAPGMSITARVGDSTRTLSGTSMATPIVSGVSALALDANSSLVGEPALLMNYLEDTAEPLPNAGVTEVGDGRVSAYNAVNDVEPDKSQQAARDTGSKLRDEANGAHSGSFWRGLGESVSSVSFSLPLATSGVGV